MDDIWYVIDLLKQELEEHNATNKKKFTLYEAIKSHIPFFACSNHFLDKEYQRNLQRYIYCQKMKVSPYEGDYGKHPKKWIDKCNIIEKMLNYIQSKDNLKIQNG
jgi:uncharacterized coiled-coil DUF342 family protein